MSGIYDVTIEQGASWELLVSIEDPDGDPVDLTGVVARAQIRSANGRDLYAELIGDEADPGADDRIEFLDPDTLGYPTSVRLWLTAAETAALDFGSGVWSLEMATDSATHRRLSGAATLSKRVIVEETT